MSDERTSRDDAQRSPQLMTPQPMTPQPMTPQPMTGFDPDHPSGCAAIVAEVWMMLDDECTPENQERLRRHLEECPACLRHYGVEERVKRLIASKCSGEKAPDRLRQRLRVEISRTTIIRNG